MLGCAVLSCGLFINATVQITAQSTDANLYDPWFIWLEFSLAIVFIWDWLVYFTISRNR